MYRRIGLALLIVAVGALSFPLLGGIGSAQTTSPTIYTFEECEEGWTTESNSLPLAPSWERSSPGHNSEFAFYLADYIDLQEETLISPVHAVDGSPITVSYFITFDTEPIADDGTIYDPLTFDWSSDGENWETLNTHAGQNEGFPEFIEASATFTPPAGTMQVRFHFTSDEQVSSTTEGYAGIAVDDITIPTARPDDATCDAVSPEPEPSGSPEPDPSGSPEPGGGDNPRGCTITGTAKGETLRGTSGDDVICGLGGDDVIKGLGGNDVLFGDAGNDKIIGGPGNDELRGAKGRDDLRGGGGNDSHHGGGGRDTCSDNRGRNSFDSCKHN